MKVASIPAAFLFSGCEVSVCLFFSHGSFLGNHILGKTFFFLLMMHGFLGKFVNVGKS